MNLKLQGRTIVAYLGPRGTFCEQAAKKRFSGIATLIPFPNTTDIFRAVEEEKADYGVVPIESSLGGSIDSTLDLLLASNLMVCGEVDFRVVQNLIVKPGTKLGDIKVVMSHPKALAQCRIFLKQNLSNAERKEVSSTAKAVELLEHTDNAGALGAELAAMNYGMEILVRGIEDRSNNVTRFLVLSREDSPPTGKDKTSLILSVEDVPGALYRILGILAVRDINLTKLDSRPEKSTPWKYIFYLDFKGHRTEDKIWVALEEMAKRCSFLKVLGSYPKSH